MFTDDLMSDFCMGNNLIQSQDCVCVHMCHEAIYVTIKTCIWYTDGGTRGQEF